MSTLNRGILPALLLAATLVAGCGGRSDVVGVTTTTAADVASPVAGAPDDIGTSVTALLAYINGLFMTSENSDPVNVNALTLAVDDAGEPAAVTF